jgi:hypothetical protein
MIGLTILAVFLIGSVLIKASQYKFRSYGHRSSHAVAR